MRRYELAEQGAGKFWEIATEGATQTVTFGRLGAKGQTKSKQFDSAAEATAAEEKLVAEKLKKGYVLAISGTPSVGRAGPHRDASGVRIWQTSAQLVARTLPSAESREVVVERAAAALSLLQAGEVEAFMTVIVAAARAMPEALVDLEVGYWLLAEASSPRITLLQSLASAMETTDLPAVARLARHVCHWIFADDAYIHEMAARRTAGDGGYKTLATKMLQTRKKLAPVASRLRAVADDDLFARFERFTWSSWQDARSSAEAAVREFSFEPRYVRMLVWTAWALQEHARAVEVYERYGEGLVRTTGDGSLDDEEGVARIVASHGAVGRYESALKQLDGVFSSVNWGRVKSPLLLDVMGCAYAQRGDAATSASFLEKMLRRRDPAFGWKAIATDAELAPVQSAPEIRALEKLASALGERPTPARVREMSLTEIGLDRALADKLRSLRIATVAQVFDQRSRVADQGLGDVTLEVRRLVEALGIDWAALLTR